MADLMRELRKIDAERSKTSDPAKLQELDYRAEQVPIDYRERINCGYLSDVLSDFDLESII